MPGAVLAYDVRPTSSTAPVLLPIGSPMGASGFGTLAGHFRRPHGRDLRPARWERSEKTDPTTDRRLISTRTTSIGRPAIGRGPVDLRQSEVGAHALPLVAITRSRSGRSWRTSHRRPRSFPIASGPCGVPRRPRVLPPGRDRSRDGQVHRHRESQGSDRGRHRPAGPGPGDVRVADRRRRLADRSSLSGTVSCTHYQFDFAALRAASTGSSSASEPNRTASSPVAPRSPWPSGRRRRSRSPAAMADSSAANTARPASPTRSLPGCARGPHDGVPDRPGLQVGAAPPCPCSLRLIDAGARVNAMTEPTAGRPMNDQDWLAERFEANRSHLRGVAFRMLGSVSEADDAVQRRIRLSRTDTSERRQPRAWLTTASGGSRSTCCVPQDPPRIVTGHPRPIHRECGPAEGVDPEQEVLLGDWSGSRCSSSSIRYARGTGRLRAARRLRRAVRPDRAHRRADTDGRQAAREPSPSPGPGRARARRRPCRPMGRGRRVPCGGACRRLRGLLAVLDPQVVVRSDGGVARRGLASQVRGAKAAAEQAMSFRQFAGTSTHPRQRGPRRHRVVPRRNAFAVLALTVKGGRIVAIDVLADPHRLAQLESTMATG